MNTKADLTKRPDEVAGMFDEVAKGYDRANLVLSAMLSECWRSATVRAIDPRPGEKVLDLAAGTGASSVPIAAKGAEVISADFSDGMLAVGRAKHPSLQFVHADAMALPFDDDEFDAVTISFGLRNVTDVPKALSELLRVTRPAGRLVITEFSHVTAPVIGPAYEWYLHNVLPKVARFVGSNKPAYAYLAESIDAWPDQFGLGGLIHDAGWRSVEFRNLTMGIVAVHRAVKQASKLA